MQKLLQEQEQLRKQRLEILDEVNILLKVSGSDAALLECGKKLIDNTNKMRGIRYDIATYVKSKTIKPAPKLVIVKPKPEISKRKEENKAKNKNKRKKGKKEMASKLSNKTVEDYKALKESGLSDTKICKEWGVHAMALHKFKQDNGLVRSRKNLDSNVSNVPEAADLPEVAPETAPAQQLVNEPTAIELPEVQNDVEASNTITEVKELIESLRSEIAVLVSENSQLKNELWQDRISRLYRLQAQLDEIICTKHGIQLQDHADEQLLALITEISEAINEEASFKYWKVNKNVDRELLIMELVDVLHFILSRGLMCGADKTVHVAVVKCENVTKQFLAMLSTAVMLEWQDPEVQKGKLTELLNIFIGLTEMLDFKWVDIESAYSEKHRINISRQNENY